MRAFFMVSGPATAIETLLTAGVTDRMRTRGVILAREATSCQTDRRM
jgi:hypothetical protein